MGLINGISVTVEILPLPDSKMLVKYSAPEEMRVTLLINALNNMRDELLAQFRQYPNASELTTLKQLADYPAP